MSELHIDVRALGDLARDLKRADPLVGKAFTTSIKKAGDIVAAEAKIIASEASSRIPKSIRVVGGQRRVAVRAGGARAPHAAAFEHGGQPGTFRHPVFGNREVWKPQQAHPFLHPADERKGPAYLDAVTVIVGEALNSVGL